jgi:hypothetical protein
VSPLSSVPDWPEGIKPVPWFCDFNTVTAGTCTVEMLKQAAEKPITPGWRSPDPQEVDVRDRVKAMGLYLPSDP